jgi:hypothetical protein
MIKEDEKKRKREKRKMEMRMGYKEGEMKQIFQTKITLISKQ